MTRADVKAHRRYDSSGRLSAAQARRRYVLDAAGCRFFRDGYAATTVASVANDAGVSVEMVYKAYGGKAGLVRALCERALAGEGPVHAELRSDEVSSTESDPALIIASWARLSREVAPRVAPILLLVRAAAASDPEMQRLQDELGDQRQARMAHNADALAQPGHLRQGVGRDHARDVLLTYTAPEIYELLVLRQGWSLEDYSQFIRQGVAAALL